MSNIKYNDTVCDTVIHTIDGVVMSLEDAVTELQAFLNGLPSDAQIDAQLNKVSKVAKRDCNGNVIDYVVSRDVRVRKRNQYVVPFNKAKENIQSTKEEIAQYAKNVEEMNEKIRKLQSLIAEFEVKSNTKTETGEDGQPYEYGPGGPGGGGTTVTEEEGKGKTDLNIDTDGDGKPDLNIDIDGDGKADLNIDTNGDGKPDINIDIDGDGKADLNIDVDNDGAPDINIDLDGDGKADLNIDTDNNGKPDLNIDLNGDGKADLNIDTDGDGKPDINIDVDGDGAADLNIDTDGDGKPDVNIDADGDGKVDPKPGQGDNNKPPKVEEDPEPETKPETKPSGDSDLFDKDEANRTSGGFADNIAAGGAGVIGAGAVAVAGGGSGRSTSTKATTAEEEAEALFAFLPGGASEESSDFMYRGLFDQSGSGDVGSINYQSLDGGGVGVAKGAAAVAAVGLGVSGVDAFATLNEQRKMEGDITSTDSEKDEKKTIKTIISSGILGILTIAFVITVLSPHANIIAIILLGLAMAVSAIASSTGLKIGKYIGFGVLLVTSILTFILSSAGIISPVGYIVIFGSFVVLSAAAILLDLLKGMFNDKLDLVPILVAIAAGLLIAMFKVLNIINWIVFVILLVLTVGGYFLYEKVIKNKLPDSEEDMAQAVTYAQVQTVQPVAQENVVQTDVQIGVQPEAQAEVQQNIQMNAQMGAQASVQPVVQPFAQSNDQQFSQSSDQQFSQSSGQAGSQNFDPRALYDQTENAHPSITDRINTEPQNPFAGYNPMNTSFSNAFKDDDNNNNNSGTFDGFM